jgi:hypothetical protein
MEGTSNMAKQIEVISTIDVKQISNLSEYKNPKAGKTTAECIATITARGKANIAVATLEFSEADFTSTTIAAAKKIGLDGKGLAAACTNGTQYKVTAPAKDAWLELHGLELVKPGKAAGSKNAPSAD